MCDTYFLVILQVLGVTLVLFSYILTFFFCLKFAVAIENACTSTSNGTTRANKVSFLLAAVVFYILSQDAAVFKFHFPFISKKRTATTTRRWNTLRAAKSTLRWT